MSKIYKWGKLLDSNNETVQSYDQHNANNTSTTLYNSQISTRQGQIDMATGQNYHQIGKFIE